MIQQGEIWWADLPEPEGPAAGFRRPVVVVQSDAFNRSRLKTVVCVPLTSNLAWAEAAGNVLLPARETKLPKDSVALVPGISAFDRSFLTERISRLSRNRTEAILLGIDLLLGR